MPRRRVGLWFAVLAGVALIVCAASLLFGAGAVGPVASLDTLMRALTGRVADDNAWFAIESLRAPRTAIGVLVGAALAVAGALLQAVTRNPLAEPGLLGVSGGATLAVAIAIALGATHAMATRMVVEDGEYTGEIEFYCYGEGKAEAIRALAAREGYALQHCYAYSDSITDLPMLETVGHPTVVNPDRALRKEAGTRGWPVRSFSKPVSLRDRIPAPSTSSKNAT